MKTIALLLPLTVALVGCNRSPQPQRPSQVSTIKSRSPDVTGALQFFHTNYPTLGAFQIDKKNIGVIWESGAEKEFEVVRARIKKDFGVDSVISATEGPLTINVRPRKVKKWDMLMKIFCTLLIALGSLCLAPGRLIRSWTYSQLFDASDLVVLAHAKANQDTQDKMPNVPNPDNFVGINTKFEVRQVLKPNNPILSNLVVLHFRHSDKVTVFANGALFFTFRTEPKHVLRTEVVFQPDRSKSSPVTKDLNIPAPDYLLFLKARPDGRYEPVTGFYDSALSVREVFPPGWEWDYP